MFTCNSFPKTKCFNLPATGISHNNTLRVGTTDITALLLSILYLQPPSPKKKDVKQFVEAPQIAETLAAVFATHETEKQAVFQHGLQLGHCNKVLSLLGWPRLLFLLIRPTTFFLNSLELFQTITLRGHTVLAAKVWYRVGNEWCITSFLPYSRSMLTWLICCTLLDCCFATWLFMLPDSFLCKEICSIAWLAHTWLFTHKSVQVGMNNSSSWSWCLPCSRPEESH